MIQGNPAKLAQKKMPSKCPVGDDGASSEPEVLTEFTFDDRLEEAIRLAEKHSGFSQFHDSYRPLFCRLWRAQDPEETGSISAAGASEFAVGMVAAGWVDWAPSAREQELWKALEDAGGCITVEEFAEISENEGFTVTKKKHPKAEAGARMAQAHRDRMENFNLPGGTAKKKSKESHGHCVDCEFQPMCQHPYCGQCSFCPKRTEEEEEVDLRLGRLMDYQCMCEGCALRQGVCCGCGCPVK